MHVTEGATDVTVTFATHGSDRGSTGTLGVQKESTISAGAAPAT